RLLAPVLRRPGRFVIAGAAWVGLGLVLLPSIDQELMPRSDRGLFFVSTSGPEGSTIEYMDRYQTDAERIVKGVPEVDRLFSVIAVGAGAPGPVNEGLLLANLVPASERHRSSEQIIRAIKPDLDAIPGIQAFAATPSEFSGFLAAPVSFVVEGDDVFALKGLA